MSCIKRPTFNLFSIRILNDTDLIRGSIHTTEILELQLCTCTLIRALVFEENLLLLVKGRLKQPLAMLNFQIYWDFWCSRKVFSSNLQPLVPYFF
jgi:hypothetical protein